MRRFLCVQWTPYGPRCFVLRQRVHHGATGCVVAAAAVTSRHRTLALLAAAAILHDIHDLRVWFAREVLL